MGRYILSDGNNSIQSHYANTAMVQIMQPTNNLISPPSTCAVMDNDKGKAKLRSTNKAIWSLSRKVTQVKFILDSW